MNLTKENFDKTLEKNRVVMVDFWAEWCSPCRMLTPIVEEVQNLMPNNVAKVNIEKEKDLAVRFGIRSIPTVIIFKDGEIMERIPGISNKGTYIDKLKYYMN
jgi:thioredoxin 1